MPGIRITCAYKRNHYNDRIKYIVLVTTVLPLGFVMYHGALCMYVYRLERTRYKVDLKALCTIITLDDLTSTINVAEYISL